MRRTEPVADVDLEHRIVIGRNQYATVDALARFVGQSIRDDRDQTRAERIADQHERRLRIDLAVMCDHARDRISRRLWRLLVTEKLQAGKTNDAHAIGGQRISDTAIKSGPAAVAGDDDGDTVRIALGRRDVGQRQVRYVVGLYDARRLFASTPASECGTEIRTSSAGSERRQQRAECVNGDRGAG